MLIIWAKAMLVYAFYPLVSVAVAQQTTLGVIKSLGRIDYILAGC
jgi:hypothetical protein